MRPQCWCQKAKSEKKSSTNSTTSSYNMSGSSGRSWGKGIVLILSSSAADQRGSRIDLSFPFATFKSALTNREIVGSGRTASMNLAQKAQPSNCSGTML